MTIQRVTILGGHTSPDTAYLVDDYPYGYTLWCKIRYWVETATKGTAKGQQRFVADHEPKAAGEPWNKPKASTYTSLVVMYLDDVEHVKSFHVSCYLSPVGDARFRLMGLYDQLDESTRAKYDQLLRIAQEGYPDPWDDFEAAVSALAAHLDRHRDTPKLDGAVWTDDNGRRHYLGDNPDVYLTLARQRAEETA